MSETTAATATPDTRDTRKRGGKPWSRKQKIIGVMLFPALLLGMMAAEAVMPEPAPAPPSVAQLCGLNESDVTPGRPIVLNSNTVPLTTITCVLKAEGFSEATWQKMTTTRALDGQMSDKGAMGLTEATWTYHPDQGLTVIIE